MTPAGNAKAQQVPPQPVRPASPVYTPTQQTPPVQPKPVVPVYTPPATPPVQPRVEQPYVAPTVAQKPKPAPEPLYVPPVTQNPAVQPQPKVTMMPTNTAATDTPATPPQARPQPQYYIPSNQQATPSQAQQIAASQPTIIDQPAQAQQQTVNATVPWGVLTFADGKQVQLVGASALVGRYDHDLGGDRPAVDLSDQQGADTTSRVHAVFEHNGNTYTLTDLNSTNSTRVNNKRLEPDKATPINDGDTIQFGKVSTTYKKL